MWNSLQDTEKIKIQKKAAGSLTALFALLGVMRFTKGKIAWKQSMDM